MSAPPIRRYPPTVFNITNFGAVGDGLTDNTTSIQKTINEANTTGGGIVEISAGTFESDPITLYDSVFLRLVYP